MSTKIEVRIEDYTKDLKYKITILNEENRKKAEKEKEKKEQEKKAKEAKEAKEKEKREKTQSVFVNSYVPQGNKKELALEPSTIEGRAKADVIGAGTETARLVLTCSKELTSLTDELYFGPGFEPRQAAEASITFDGSSPSSIYTMIHRINRDHAVLLIAVIKLEERSSYRPPPPPRDGPPLQRWPEPGTLATVTYETYSYRIETTGENSTEFGPSSALSEEYTYMPSRIEVSRAITRPGPQTYQNFGFYAPDGGGYYGGPWDYTAIFSTETETGSVYSILWTRFKGVSGGGGSIMPPADPDNPIQPGTYGYLPLPPVVTKQVRCMQWKDRQWSATSTTPELQAALSAINADNIVPDWGPLYQAGDYPSIDPFYSYRSSQNWP
jgi:hypothetical protein